jgi:hypothetical protein
MLPRGVLNGCKCGKKRTVAVRNLGLCCKKDSARAVLLRGCYDTGHTGPRHGRDSVLSVQPSPRVFVLLGAAFFSRNSMIMPAMSLPVAVSMPSRPGVEFTSITTGP